MAFKKGVSGNYDGRPKGSLNKSSLKLRETIFAFLEEKFEFILKDIESLPAKERVKLYFDLLNYGLPKLQSVQMESEFDKFSDFQLDLIIEEIKNAQETK
jgi:hypothetical protein